MRGTRRPRPHGCVRRLHLRRLRLQLCRRNLQLPRRRLWLPSLRHLSRLPPLPHLRLARRRPLRLLQSRQLLRALRRLPRRLSLRRVRLRRTHLQRHRPRFGLRRLLPGLRLHLPPLREPLRNDHRVLRHSDPPELRRNDRFKHQDLKVRDREPGKERVRNRPRCGRLRLPALLPRVRDLRLLRVHPCPRGEIADRFQAQVREGSVRADRVRVNRCARCPRGKADGLIRLDLADRAVRVADLLVSQDHLNSGVARCPVARVQAHECPGVRECCRRCRRTKCRRRQSRASRYIRGNRRSVSVRYWTNARLKVSASCIRRGSVQEQGEP